ncbi:asparagine synthase-related protein [Streptomyces sp. NBC_01433]|uniref:asparagine synthetase B family protein n=1 Tax=Streptomyces sp. NBC_01433 TaxID=2903864 RepID=UPI002256DAB1|nr:asparagine synthase-related protein [Streptomyces sp. NBC_01433]MCX4681280.1 asparagine synthase-related protein [Streptomyces sp. NBC_01433]
MLHEPPRTELKSSTDEEEVITMCGIGGILLKRRTSADRDGMMRRLAPSLAHRGRSEEGSYTDERVALHCSRHAVIAVDEARQPLVDSRGELVMVGNGEVLNHRQLAPRLPSDRLSRLRPGDLQVALELYADRGAAAFEDLRGPFALAVWNSSGGELTLVRDRLGERPLYYYDSPNLFVFASEIRCITAALATHRLHLDESSLLTFLGLGRITDDRTPYREIRAVTAGAVLRIGDGDPGSRRIASLTPVSQLRTAPADEAEVDHLLDQAQRRALVADRPVAVGFSGGIDSSAVLKAALDASGAAAAITVYSDRGPEPDENLRRARMLARVLGVELLEVPFRIPSLDDTVHLLNSTLDGPAAEPLVLHNDALHSVARDHSAVLLGGHGADEVFGGYARYTALRSAAEGTTTQEWMTASLWERWNRAVNWQNFVSEHAGPELAPHAEIHGAPLERPFAYSDFEDSDPVLFGQALDLFRLMTYDNFRATDENGIARGVEVRSPFFDLDLIAGVFSLPVDRRLRPGSPKHLLRRVFRGTALKGAFTERKVGFDDHFSYADWMTDNWPAFSGAITDGPLPGTGVLRNSVFDDLEKLDWRQLWRLFSLSTWLDRAAL